MANPFLNGKDRDVETAIMLENAYQTDIGKAVAYTDGDRVFINTDDNLFNILPAYDHKMLKWLLWHERFHMELRHHNRFFKFLEELDEKETKDKFELTKSEVNIIMDILVHDSLSKMFPDLVETALINLAQMRNRNSLGYTFKTNTLEEMLGEYRKFKKGDPADDSKDTSDEDKDHKKDDDRADEKGKGIKDKGEKKDKGDEGKTGSKDKGHTDGGKKDKPEDLEDKPEGGKPEVNKDTPEPEPDKLPDEHDKTDWSKLDDLDDKEFIDECEGNKYVDQINKLKRKKIKLGKLTETLNSLATSTRQRTYAMPNPIQIGSNVVLKGSKPGRTNLHLCFDASGSMNSQMNVFKEIISKSIPHAMKTPTTWFSGAYEKVPRDPEGRSPDYYKGTFEDFMPVVANSGYSDDGDRTIELCWRAEQAGYTPIGITDGGGRLSWSENKLKELKRTILVGQDPDWLKEVKKINPKIQTLDI